MQDKNMLTALIKARANAGKLNAINDVATRVERGIYKRIDENRELLELLRSRCPGFLAQHWWVEGWLLSQDSFLIQLASAAQVPNPHEGRNQSGHGRTFPRPWPGLTTMKEGGDGPLHNLEERHNALRDAVELLGLDAKKIVDEMLDSHDATCKRLALAAAHVEVTAESSQRNTGLSDAGVAASKKWLEGVRNRKSAQRAPNAGAHS